MLDRDVLQAIREGASRPAGLASIVIAHYQTEPLVRLCLRAVRRFTDHPFETIVVDNGSADGSLDYLRSVGWVRLIERGASAEANGVVAHAAAMDLGTTEARGRWLVSLHTDTIVHRPGWLGELLARLSAQVGAACLGSGKLDDDPAWYAAIKRLVDKRRYARALARLWGRPPPPRAEEPDWYARTYAAVYDLDRVRELGLSFAPAPDRRAGEQLYRGLVEAGHTAVRLPPEEMRRYVHHIGHGTALLGRGGLRRWRDTVKVRRRVRRTLGGPLARELLDDETLDR